jgi:small subunit ribosomal protein S17
LPSKGPWWVNALKTGSTEHTGRHDTMQEHRDIGVDVKTPTGEWDGDANCPFYGSLRLRGQVLEGTVSSVNMQKTITIERNNVRYMKKYERFEKRTSAVSAHLPSCIGDVNIGDTVKIMECRPLSKTVSFCVIENSGGVV